ncbi:hypothetical protein ABHI18_012368 [Aspergillus niger]
MRILNIINVNVKPEVTKKVIGAEGLILARLPFHGLILFVPKLAWSKFSSWSL